MYCQFIFQLLAGRADRYGCPHKHLGLVIYTANMAILIAPSPSTALSQPVPFSNHV
jgi:hypothetical protein